MFQTFPMFLLDAAALWKHCKCLEFKTFMFSFEKGLAGKYNRESQTSKT
jgi:hypothetical protein